MALEIVKLYDEDKNVWIAKPIGEVDIFTSPKFKEELVKIVEEIDTDLMIDGEELEYIDSTGLGVLISILKRMREKGKTVILINIKDNISKLLDITGLNKVFIVK